MQDNTLQFTSDAGKMQIVPSPIVVFTRDDAIRAARTAPIKELPDHENAIIVMTAISPEGVITRKASFIVTHHAQSHRTKKMRVMGSWEVKGIPVLRSPDHLHIFNVAWPPDAPVVQDDVAVAK